jgi:ring-1,2-phenylacetyl-CoA epoxidase subunit PaaC
MTSPGVETLLPTDADVRDALVDLLLALADDEFVIGFSDSEWTGIAPMLEEDVALSSLAQDELGHATALYGLVAEVTGEDPDALAYDREPAHYRHARLLDRGRGDWAMTIARRYLYDTSDAVRLEALAGGSWTPLTDLLAKIRREERYHLMHVETWLDRLARAEGEPRERLLDALRALGPDAPTVFTPLAREGTLIASGILPSPMAEHEARWREGIRETFERLDLPLPSTHAARPDGREDHGSTFQALWEQFTEVRRSEPGATW